MIPANKLTIGSGAVHKIGGLLRENGISGKLLYVSDPVVDKLYGDLIRPQLAQCGTVREELVDYNSISYAMNLAERVIATDITCIVGMGGGKVLDVCKYAAYISKCPLLSIPTTMANDGIASPIAVLKRKDDLPKSLGCAVPTMIVIDTELVSKGPVELIKAGIGDTISNYMALLDWEYACQKGKDSMNGYAFIMSKTSLDALLQTQYTEICPAFIDVLANSLVLSGIAMDFAGSSRPVSGSEHLFSHALDYYCKTKNLHGLQVALGTVAVLRLIGKDDSTVLRYLKRFHVDVNPAHMGISCEDFVLCMQKATSMRSNRYTYLEDADLSTERLTVLYEGLKEDL